MFRFIRKRSIPPCKECKNCIIMSWNNLFGGEEYAICCRLKSNSSGNYCRSSSARGSKQCKYQEGIPTTINSIYMDIF